MKSVHRKIQWLWENPAHRWNDGQIVGIIIPLHKKGDETDMNNFRGRSVLIANHEQNFSENFGDKVTKLGRSYWSTR